ncbi:MAG: SpoIIE family protein phosphatase [Candidatus Brocadiaceae bacterium]|nr:SpoIIE family protein phosphatase [Candidatus Brocadiaceae bacterium]
MARISDAFSARCTEAPTALVGALVDSMPYPLIVRDMDRRVVLANREAERSFGGDLLSCRCHEIEVLRRSVCGHCPAQEALDQRRAVDREVSDPETGRILFVTVFPMLESDGTPCGVIETARDVTEERRAAARTRDLLARVTEQNEELSAWRRSFDYELRTAREIQQMLVPGRPFCMGGMCFDFLCRPSGQIGGDLYDICPVGPHGAGLLVCDASGHGVAAALLAVMVKMVFRTSGLVTGSPTRVMRALNRRLVQMSPAQHFATGFYAVYDSETHAMRYAACGHPAPLVVRAGSQDVEELPGGGMVLGGIEEIQVDERSAQVEPGDRFLVYTDGVTDCTNRAGERFGIERLRAAAREGSRLRGPEFLQCVVRHVDEFADGAPPADDLTLVVAEHTHDEPAWLAAYGQE